MLFIVYLSYASVAADLIPVYFGFRVRSKLNSAMCLLLVYVCVAFLTDMALFFLGLQGMNNLWVIRIFTPVEFALLMLVFHSSFDKRLERALALSVTVLFVAFALFDIIAWKDPKSFNTIAKATSAVVLVIASSYSLVRLRLSSISNLWNEPRLWVSIAILLHFGVAAVVYVANDLILTLPTGLVYIPWAVKAMANTVTNLLFAKGFLCLRTR